jgi:hypothetical protein
MNCGQGGVLGCCLGEVNCKTYEGAVDDTLEHMIRESLATCPHIAPE